jgi:hypothetical protein
MGGDITSMKKKKNTFKFLFKIPGGKRSHGRFWEERLGEIVYWIHLVQDNVRL